MSDTLEQTERRPAAFPGLAGAIGAGIALGVIELAAGLLSRVPSVVAAVGGVVVDVAPPVVKDVAIALLGTADKGALAVGVTVVSLLIGVAVGRWSAVNQLVAPLVFTGFGVVGFAAAVREPNVLLPAVAIVLAIGALAGIVVLRRLLELDAAAADPTAGMPAARSRRRFLRAAGGYGAGALAAGAAGRMLLIRESEAAVEAATVPVPVVRALSVGPEHMLDVPAITPIVVPNDEFYRIDTALLVPRVDRDSWRLSVTGMVERELELTYGDLESMDLYERYVTIACVSNAVGGDLVGNAKWTGVRLAAVLELAGVSPAATQIVGRSVDGWTAGFPTEAVFDGRDPLIAIGMNDEPLPARHGFPARLIVPGLYGYVSATKWLEEIQLTTWEGFDGYWVPRGWSKTGPIKTQSRIDYPRRGETVAAARGIAGGVAWAPTRGIARVEVRIDEDPWIEAELSTPLSDHAWVQWRAEFTTEPGRRRLQVRATDGSGATQTEIETASRPDGATGWHSVEFEAV